jgi:hypothetical protein
MKEVQDRTAALKAAIRVFRMRLKEGVPFPVSEKE